jgi:hypothetical protein
MPVDQITNPTAEEGEAYLGGGQVVEMYQYDPAASGNLLNGMTVALEALTSPSVGPVLIKKATTTPDFLMLGIVTGAPTGGYTPGQVVEVVVDGYALALFDANNTTAGHLGLQSSTTAGDLTDSATATLGKTMCTILSSVTIASGSALVPVYVHKM